MKDVTSELTELQNDVKNEDNINSFMEPGKKKRGRKPGSKNKPKDANGPAYQSVNPMGGSNPEVPNIEATKNLVKPAIAALSVLGVRIAEDDAAAMQETEMSIIVDSAAACVNQYLPGVLGAHANAVILSVALGQWSLRVYLLRLATIERMKREKELKEKHVN